MLDTSWQQRYASIITAVSFITLLFIRNTSKIRSSRVLHTIKQIYTTTYYLICWKMFDDFTAIKMWILVFCVVIPCNLIDGCQWLEGHFLLHCRRLGTLVKQTKNTSGLFRTEVNSPNMSSEVFGYLAGQEYRSFAEAEGLQPVSLGFCLR
jgi:hypothetical protein